jgi:hypothetical protein
MRQRKRSPILNLLQLAIVGFVFWQVSRAMGADPGDDPAATFDSVYRSIRLIAVAVVAMAALNLLYPLAAWGIGQLRERQRAWNPQRSAVAPPAATEPVDAHCPGCGASLFDDAPTCPWCGHALR